MNVYFTFVSYLRKVSNYSPKVINLNREFIRKILKKRFVVLF
jgi:hypothetical protein